MSFKAVMVRPFDEVESHCPGSTTLSAHVIVDFYSPVISSLLRLIVR
jgi:hypothetical protein